MLAAWDHISHYWHNRTGSGWDVLWVISLAGLNKEEECIEHIRTVKWIARLILLLIIIWIIILIIIIIVIIIIIIIIVIIIIQGYTTRKYLSTSNSTLCWNALHSYSSCATGSELFFSCSSVTVISFLENINDQLTSYGLKWRRSHESFR